MTPPFLPSFSVVICNYNYARFVGQAIQSVLDQDYPAHLVQLVVVDDGSTDPSREVIASFEADPRVKVVHQPNRGQAAAFDAGVGAATGDYVCLLDSDDLYHAHKLAAVATHISALGEDPGNLLLCHDLVMEDAVTATTAPQTWFDVVGVSQLPDTGTLERPVQGFPFSIPCGLVFSRRVISACLAALPSWAFPRGADGVLCPAALLMTGRVHYLRQCLGTYRIHGGNGLAGMVDGQYVPRFDWRVRTPRTLRFLEQWVDVLDLPSPRRAVAHGYLRHVEQMGRSLSASRGLLEPEVTVAVIGSDRDDGDTVSVSLQSHGRVQWLPSRPEDAGTADDFERMALAYSRSEGDYVVFLRAGDRLDREFVERHLLFRQHGALVGLTCSDVRLCSRNGSLVHADVFANSGAWKQAVQQVPPLATGLRDWVVPPVSACMFRRTALLDRFFSQRAHMPAALRAAGFWLLVQLQHHTAGLLRLRETLTTCRMPDGAAASYAYLSAPVQDERFLSPPVSLAVQWFRHFYQQEFDLFRRWLPPVWHQRFELWLLAQASESDAPRVQS